jgi:hypothetical protein
MSFLRLAVGLVIVSGLAPIAGAARADEDGTLPPDQPKPGDDGAVYRLDRTWLYVDDASLPAPLHAVASTRVTYTSEGTSPTRPFASNIGTPGAMLEMGGEVGLIDRLSLTATGVAGESGTGATASGAVAGLRLSLLPASWRSARAVASAGYLRELQGNNGAWGRLSVTEDVGRARFAQTVHGEHIFAQGRDSVDVMVMAGATYRVLGPFRAGVEYVGQDIEESFDAEAEGGVRHFVGPTASVQLLDERLSIVGGPSVGLSYASPKLLGRVGLAYSF